MNDYLAQILATVVAVAAVLGDGRFTRSRVDQLDGRLTEHINSTGEHEAPRPARHGR